MKRFLGILLTVTMISTMLIGLNVEAADYVEPKGNLILNSTFDDSDGDGALNEMYGWGNFSLGSVVDGVFVTSDSQGGVLVSLTIIQGKKYVGSKMILEADVKQLQPNEIDGMQWGLNFMIDAVGVNEAGNQLNNSKVLVALENSDFLESADGWIHVKKEITLQTAEECFSNTNPSERFDPSLFQFMIAKEQGQYAFDNVSLVPVLEEPSETPVPSEEASQTPTPSDEPSQTPELSVSPTPGTDEPNVSPSPEPDEPDVPKVKKPAKPRIKKIKSTAKKTVQITLATKVKNAKSLQVQIAKKKSFKGAKTVKVKKATKAFKVKHSIIKKKAVLYFRVRGVGTKSAKGKYSVGKSYNVKK